MLIRLIWWATDTFHLSFLSLYSYEKGANSVTDLVACQTDRYIADNLYSHFLRYSTARRISENFSVIIIIIWIKTITLIWVIENDYTWVVTLLLKKLNIHFLIGKNNIVLSKTRINFKNWINQMELMKSIIVCIKRKIALHYTNCFSVSVVITQLKVIRDNRQYFSLVAAGFAGSNHGFIGITETII
jgi:hypothetical protein